MTDQLDSDSTPQRKRIAVAVRLHPHIANPPFFRGRVPWRPVPVMLLLLLALPAFLLYTALVTA